MKDIGWTNDGTEQITKYVDTQLADKKLVLAAEDSGVAREVLKKFFDKAQIAHEIYPNGRLLLERMEEIDTNNVGMIITDIEMPEVDGFQVAQFFKGNNRFSHIPVIVNSSMTTEAVKNKMDAIGVDGFVGKTDIKSLFSIVSQHLK